MSIFFFTSLIILGNIVMLTLFLAILLRQFEIKDFDNHKEDESEVIQLFRYLKSQYDYITNSIGKYLLETRIIRYL